MPWHWNGVRVTAPAILMLSVLVGAQANQSQSPTFHSDTDYIELPVRVVDGRGQFVKGLTADDFRVMEDGRPQTIANFETVDIPFTAAPLIATQAEPIDPVAPNGAIDVDGRLYLFVVDDLLLESDFTMKVRTVLGHFIRDKMSGNDAAAVVLTSGAATQDFTRDRTLLLGAVNRVIGQYDGDTDGRFVKSWTQQTLNTVWRVSHELASIERRQKALVLVTQSSLCNAMAADEDDCAMVDAILQTASRSNTTIYTLDPRGLISPRRETAAWRASRRDSGLPTTERGSSTDGAYETVRDAAAAFRISGLSMTAGSRILAEESGGFAVTRTNNFDAFLDRLVAENSAYYLIGYYSTNASSPQKSHKHQVTVARRGVRVFHRPGYAK